MSTSTFYFKHATCMKEFSGFPICTLASGRVVRGGRVHCLTAPVNVVSMSKRESTSFQGKPELDLTKTKGVNVAVKSLFTLTTSTAKFGLCEWKNVRQGVDGSLDLKRRRV